MHDSHFDFSFDNPFGQLRYPRRPYDRGERGCAMTRKVRKSVFGGAV